MRGVVVSEALEIMQGKRHQFSVCPHDTAKSAFGWVYLNAYLQRRLKLRLGFEPMDDFLEEREAVIRERRPFVYANPTSAMRFVEQLGYRPLARPAGRFDETILVAGGAWRPSQASGRMRVASATDQLAIHALGIRVLAERGFDLREVDFAYTGSHLAAARAVLRGEADLAFLFNETWAGMTDFVRDQLTVLGATSDQRVFHCFLVGGELLERADDIQRLLVRIAGDREAAHILEELALPDGFEAVREGEFERLCETIRTIETEPSPRARQ